MHEAPFSLAKENGLRLEAVLQWTESTDEHLRSYVNGIPTGSGGTHENGFRAGLGKAVRNFIETHNLSPKGVTLTAEDIREGLTGVLSVFLAEPQFQGQTKDRLNNPEVTSAVDGLVRPALEHWLNTQHLDRRGDRRAASSWRRGPARPAARRRPRSCARARPPGGSTCRASSPTAPIPGAITSELFVVEGDSAGGSAKQGRDRARQAILPLRGKVLNTEGISTAKVLENKELSDLATALGCGVGKAFDLSRLRYGKVILLADADSDGHHIATLLLTFLYRHLPQLIAAGRVYLAQPPLYRIDIGKETFWALDEAHKAQILKQRGGRRHAGDHALQGPGRDDAQGAVGDDAEPAHPPAAARRGRRSAAHRSGDERADGQGRLGAVPLHHGAGRGRAGARRLVAAVTAALPPAFRSATRVAAAVRPVSAAGVTLAASTAATAAASCGAIISRVRDWSSLNGAGE